jgi:hypothetical protein
MEDTGAYIRLRYQRLWDEITHEDVINPAENYRIQERIRALNALGFSVGDVELASTENGNQLRLRVVVKTTAASSNNPWVDVERRRAR